MDAKELTAELKKLTDSGMKNKTLEEQIGLPKNSLSNVLSGKKEMPGKWVEKIQKYFAGKDASGLKSEIKEPEYEIPAHDKNWTTEAMKVMDVLRKENEQLKKEVAELRPDAMAWRSRMATYKPSAKGEVTITTYPEKPESNYSINTHPSKFMEEQRKKKLGF